MLIDEVLPSFDVTRVDTIVVAAPAEEVYRTALALDLVQVVREDPIVGFLLALRGIPDRVMRLLRKRPAAPAPEAMRLGDLPVEGEWIRLGEDPGHEIVFGAVGRFWKGPVQWQQSTPATFAAADALGSARIAANLAVHPYSQDRVLLTYEARTAATDDEARGSLQAGSAAAAVMSSRTMPMKPLTAVRAALERPAVEFNGTGACCRHSSG
jgi:hypothetical protein